MVKWIGGYILYIMIMAYLRALALVDPHIEPVNDRTELWVRRSVVKEVEENDGFAGRMDGGDKVFPSRIKE